MVIVQLVAFTLLVISETSSIGRNELEFGWTPTSALIALVLSAFVFPIALQPLVRWVASALFRSEDGHRGNETDRVLLRKFGFALSAFSDEFDAVLEPAEYRRVSRARRAVEFGRLRAASYVVAVLPLAVLGFYVPDRLLQLAYISMAGAAVLTLVLAAATVREGRGLSMGYWTLRASMAVHHRFDVLAGLNLRLPVSLSEERERWKDADALVVGRHHLFDDPHPNTAGPYRLDPAETKLVERRIRYVFDEPARGAESAVVAPAEAAPPPVEYNGFIWANLSGSDDVQTLTVTIAPSPPEDGPAEHFSVFGRRAPYAEFRVLPDTDDFDVSPSELVLRPSRDGGATASFRAVPRSDRREDPAVWVQILQNKSPVATLQVEPDRIGEGLGFSGG
jgi:hypothetical protein